MVARAHSTLGTLGLPPPFGDYADADDFDGGDDDDDAIDVYGDDGESDDQPHSFHLPANSEDSPQPTSHLDSEPDIQPFLS